MPFSAIWIRTTVSIRQRYNGGHGPQEDTDQDQGGIMQQSYANTSQLERILRGAQGLCTTLIFFITIGNLVSVRHEAELRKAWWNYVLILCGCTFPFLIYVAFLEGYVLLHRDRTRQLLVFLSITAEGVAALFWFFGFIGLIMMSMNLATETEEPHEAVKNGNYFANLFGFVNWLTFWFLSYCYWTASRSPVATADAENQPQPQHETSSATPKTTLYSGESQPDSTVALSAVAVASTAIASPPPRGTLSRPAPAGGQSIKDDETLACQVREMMYKSDSIEWVRQQLAARPQILGVYFSNNHRYLIHEAVTRCSNGDTRWVTEFLKHGADPDARSNSGATALQWTAIEFLNRPDAHLEALEQFCRAGGNINFVNEKRPVTEGQTALIIATQKTYVWDEEKEKPDGIDLSVMRLVETCIKNGAKVDGTDSSGRTALHWAVMSGCAPIVQMLVDAGADVAAVDKEKRTMLDWWTLSRNVATKSILERHMGPNHTVRAQTTKERQRHDEADSEVDSEDDVDYQRELDTYFPNPNH